MQQRSRPQEIPRLIHGINISALLLGGVILLLTAVYSTAQLLVLVPVLGLLVVYWRFRRHPSVVAWYFGMAIALFGWILLCEQIVIVDKVLGTRISTRLRLGLRLTTYVQQTLRTKDQREEESCCNDPLTWHYRPGSRYRATFDCPTCSTPYEATVDETGYLNQPLDLLRRHSHIDLFISGDSVLQGMGVPSVVEQLRSRLSLRMWNLSLQAYGPRQKISALLTYALPQAPQWLVVEFYAGNDLADAIQDDVCQHGGDFRCRFAPPEVQRRFAHHPVYSTIFDIRTDIWARMADYATENFTLATTRYLLDALKGRLKQSLTALNHALPSRDAAAQFSPPRGSLEAAPSAPVRDAPPTITQITIPHWLALAGNPPMAVREGQWLTYVQAGLAVTQQQYERLKAALAKMEHPPMVILLYHPAPYEVYREMGIELNARAEQLYPMQQEALRTLAQTYGWYFLDLTEPLRRAVRGGDIWLYGHYDLSHFSPQGTAIVANVLAAELLKIMQNHQEAHK